MTTFNETELAEAQALLARADSTNYLPCRACDGDGLVVVGWDDNAYENIEGRCSKCNGTGILKSTKTSLIKDLAAALRKALDERAELAATVDHLQNWCASPEDEAAVIEQCMADICLDCRNSVPATIDEVTGQYHHQPNEGHSSHCAASPIRVRVARERKEAVS